MGNCSKPQQKKKLHEPVRVLKQHFRFRQLQILNRFNPVQVYRLRSHFLRQKSGHGVQFQALSALYPGLSALPENYLKNLFTMLDLTRDGVICFTDFCVGAARVSLAGDEEQTRFLFDFLNIRATEEISQDLVLNALKTGALIPKSGKERLSLQIPATLSFDQFLAFSARHFDVQASIAFGTFLPSPKQQKTDVLNMMAQARGPRLGETWYLLSADWVCAWQRYVSYPVNLTSSQCELKSNPLDEDDIPTAIDNTGLCDPEIQMMLVAEEDKFVAVPEGVWTYWTELYGGGPALPRQSYQTTSGGVELDVHPCLLLCFRTKNTVYDSSKSEKILVSRFSPLSMVKVQLINVLKISDQACSLYVKQGKEWVKLTEEFRLEMVKVAVKCLLIESESPLVVSNALRETRFPAVSNEVKTVRILSPSDASIPALPQNPVDLDPVDSRSVCLIMKGVPNIGNTCYLNCVLQCLCYTPLFGQFFLNRGFALGLNTHSMTSLSPAIADMFGNMTGSKPGVPDSTRVHRLLGEQFDLFQGHDENDSYECLISLLDRLHEELKRGNTRIVLSSSLTSPSAVQLRVEIGNLWNELHGDFGSPVSDLFAGVMKTDVSCPRCPHHTVALTPAFSLDLPIPPQTHLYLTVLLLPLSGPAISLGLILSVSNTVETLLKLAKSTLGTEEIGELILISWSYGGVFSAYTQETSLQEVVHDGSVSLFAFELDIKVSKPAIVETDEAAPTPSEAQLNSQGRILLKIVHRFHVSKGAYHIRDYFPEVFYVPETITTAGLFQVLMDAVKRFLNPETDKEKVKFGIFFVDSVSKMCGICNKPECLGCGLVASENRMEWTKMKEKCVLWVQWDAPDSFLLERLNHPSLEEVVRQQSKGVDLAECLDHYSHPETLSAECSHCHSPRISTQMPVKLPDVLVVTLCRFRISENVPIKVNYLVRFPLRSLNLGKWVGCSEAEKDSCTVLTTPLQYIYDLFAVVDHIGNARSGTAYIGHYRAYCKIQEDKETWVKFDDSQSSEVQGRLEDTLVTSSAYILFYKKRIMQGKNLIQFFT